MAGTYLNLPTPVLDIIGWEDTASISGGVTLKFPIPSFLTAGVGPLGADMDLPVPQISAAGMTGKVVGITLGAPAPALVTAGVTGSSAQVAMVLPGYQLSISDGTEVVLQLPKLSLSIAAATGVIGTVSMARSAPALAITGAVPFVGNVLLSVSPQMAVSGVVGNTGATALALRSMALAIQGATGAIGNVVMTVPVIRLSVSGHGQLVGNVALTLPMLVLQASNIPASGAQFSTIAMHTEIGALTTYDNYKFNSYALFNGVYLGAKGDGIFALSGATDNGAVIDAAARVGLTDFSTSHLKRIDRCYVGYRTDGNMVLRVFTDEINVREYLLHATGKAGLHGNHVRIGKGLAARYWQFEIRNKDGADFSLDMIELKPTILRRRVGGGDA